VASTSRKPLSIALEEIAADKITYSHREPGTEDETSGGEAGAPAGEPA
jgi:DNA-directed RNA polymerase subunit K/omega